MTTGAHSGARRAAEGTRMKRERPIVIGFVTRADEARARFSKPPPSATRPRLRTSKFNDLAQALDRTNVNVATALLPTGCVDCHRGLTVIRMEHVGIDRKCDARLGVPQALADGDNIDIARDQLRGVSVAQPMKRDLGHTKALSDIAPIR